MTTARLDELITHTFHQDATDTDFSFTFDGGTWQKAGRVFSLPMVDIDGNTFIPPAIGDDVVVSGRNDFNTPSTRNYRIVGIATSGVFFDITVDGNIGSAFATFADLTIGWTAEGQDLTVITKWWARRMDFPARDLINTTDTGLVTIQDSRWEVQGLPVGREWEDGDTFEDDAGRTWTVRGVFERGRRGERLELLARNVP